MRVSYAFAFVTNITHLFYGKLCGLSSQANPVLLKRFPLRNAAIQLVQRERNQILDGDGR